MSTAVLPLTTTADCWKPRASFLGSVAGSRCSTSLALVRITDRGPQSGVLQYVSDFRPR